MPEWTRCGRSVPKSENVSFCQVLVVCIIICTSVYNLTVGTAPQSLRITLLSSSVGYLMPSPVIKVEKDHVLPDTSEQ